MTEITQIEIADTIVEIRNETIARGQKSTLPKMFTRVKEQHPGVTVADFFRALLSLGHGADPEAIIAQLTPEMQAELFATAVTEFIDRERQQIADLEADDEIEAEIERTAAECEDATEAGR